MMQEQQEPTYQVFTVLGKKYRINTNSVLTVADLKRQLHPLSKIIPKNQILINNCKVIKDDSALLASYPSPFICILAEKTNQQIQPTKIKLDQTQANTPNHYHSYERCSHHHHHHHHHHLPKDDFYHNAQYPFLNKFEQNKYKQEIESLVNKQMVAKLIQLTGEGIELATKAIRANCNDVSAAYDYVLQYKRGEISIFLFEKCLNYPQYQQVYLHNFLAQHYPRPFKTLDEYRLFVGAMKERSPQVYELLIRNKLYMEKLVITKIQYSSLQKDVAALKNKKYSLRVPLTQHEIQDYINKLQQLGMPKEQAKKCLKNAGNNLLLAEQTIINNKPIPPNKALFLLSKKSRANIVKTFFQNEAWSLFIKKFSRQKYSLQEAYSLTLNKIKKHFPQAISIIKDDISLIYPLLFGVKRNSEGVPYALTIFKNKGSPSPLKRRSLQQIQQQRSYYFGLVDKKIVQILQVLGVGKKSAQRFLRAGRNCCYLTSIFIIAGKIAVDPEQFGESQQNEWKAIQIYVHSHREYLCKKEEFELLVASLAETHPCLFEAFLKYENIYNSYKHLAYRDLKILAFSKMRDIRKSNLSLYGNIQMYYQSRKIKGMIIDSQFND